MVNLSHRLQYLAEWFPDHGRMGFSGIKDLENWVLAELGSLDVLDAPAKTGTGWKRARPAGKIYHVCAGNVSVSAETSLLISVLLGSEAIFKLPSSGLPELETRLDQLPAEWRQRISFIREHDAELMRQCDAVVVFGSDATVDSIRQECSADQKFLRYGHKISLGVVTANGVTVPWAEAAVQEILAYQQLGCLSPQSYLCLDPGQVELFSELLADAFEKQSFEAEDVPFNAKALVFDARQRVKVNGDRMKIPKETAPWTVVSRNAPGIRPGPGFGFIEVVPAPEAERSGMLEPWRGKISSVAFSEDRISPEQWEFWESYGVHRLCRMGNLQRPPIAWPHDGRPRLADLVTWTYADPDLSVA